MRVQENLRLNAFSKLVVVQNVHELVNSQHNEKEKHCKIIVLSNFKIQAWTQTISTTSCRAHTTVFILQEVNDMKKATKTFAAILAIMMAWTILSAGFTADALLSMEQQ